MLVLRVFAVEQPCAEAGRRRGAQPRDRDRHRHQGGSAPGSRREKDGMAARGYNNDATGTDGNGNGNEVESGPVMWECVIDVRGLTALPEGSRLSHLWTLPADCLLVEMSNGGLYAPGAVLCVFVHVRCSSERLGGAVVNRVMESWSVRVGGDHGASREANTTAHETRPCVAVPPLLALSSFVSPSTTPHNLFGSPSLNLNIRWKGHWKGKAPVP